MKRLALTLSLIGLSFTSLIATSAVAADYNRFLSPSSLGQDVNALNSRYQLGLKKQDWGGYANSKNYNCGLLVDTNNRNKITSIEILSNNDNCRFNTSSSGVSFDYKATKIVDVLNQVKLDEVSFIPGCFNCPSRIEIQDTVRIKRPQDKYYTEFNIEGYNNDYLEFMINKFIGKLNQDDYYPMLDKLEAYANKNPSIYNKKDVKLTAIKTYDLQYLPWRYKIGMN